MIMKIFPISVFFLVEVNNGASTEAKLTPYGGWSELGCKTRRATLGKHSVVNGNNSIAPRTGSIYDVNNSCHRRHNHILLTNRTSSIKKQTSSR